jgi:deferrochelatase/peroxidase EfeB
MADLPLDDIQGFILRSYGMDGLRLFVLRVEDAAKARAALGRLPVTPSALWEPGAKPEFCVNVALTYEGLAALQLPQTSLDSFPQDFKDGAVKRASGVGDIDDSAPANWKGNLDKPGVHALVLLFAQDCDLLDAYTAPLRALWEAGGAMSEVFVQDTNMLPGKVAHFGYRDGFSQPTIEGGLPNPAPDILPPAPAGEFLLGYPSQFAGFQYPVPAPSQLGQNGSFLALRILAQDCAAFEQLLDRAETDYGISGEKLAAKMCGRWRNGAPLTLYPDVPPPDDWTIAADTINNYDYAPTPEHPDTYDDHRGYRCPIGSHMRRNNPRSSTIAGGTGLGHRIVRRGLPYGPPFDPKRPNDGIERGLLGLFIVVSLKDQFEFLMSEWVNGDLFAPGLSGTKDPVLGASGTGGGKMTIPIEGGKKIIVSGFPRFVTTRGAAYGFIPSITALSYIAGL